MKKTLKNARLWSNKELEKVADYFSGTVINISGEMDSDKAGKRYKTYFHNAANYTLSNYVSFGFENEIILDLENDIGKELIKSYDIVFNHTVLEHIYEIRKAFANLCKIARDAVVIIVPFAQEVHYKEGVYYDYWRPTPFAVKKMFEENNYRLAYLSFNEMTDTNTYLFCVGISNDAQNKYSELIEMGKSRSDFHAAKKIQRFGSQWSTKGRIKVRAKYCLDYIMSNKRGKETGEGGGRLELFTCNKTTKRSCTICQTVT